jgi:uncharacterized protein (DUF983 family)
MGAMADPDYPTVSTIKAGLGACCPRCGKGPLFNGFLALRDRCPKCGLDYGFADPADGPAFFAITFACLPSVGFATWLELAHQAPYWAHAVTTLPLMLATLIPPLRPLKGLMVASQYANDAHEARLVDRPS